MKTLSAQPQSRTRQALTIALSLCVAATISLVNNRALGAEEDARPTSEQTSESTATKPSKQAQTDQQEQPDDKKEKGKNREIFRPSEEISEDFAVSFPVDI